MIETQCSNCKKIILKYKNEIRITNFCNISCKGLYQKGKTLEQLIGEEKSLLCKKKLSIVTSGKDNPNYKHGIHCNDSFCECGNIKDYRANKCNSCYIRKGTIGIHPSKETRKKIGIGSKEKFLKKEYREKLPEIVKKMLLTKANNGFAVNFKNKNEFDIYWKLSNWKYNVIPFLNKKDLNRIKEVGFFKPKVNNKGLVRDHFVSRKEGFINGIFPIILRHPCNCKILTMSKNSGKQYLKEDIENKIEILFDDITNFNKDWIEQKECLEKISIYKNGKRWKKPNNLLDYLTEKIRR